MGKYQHKNKTKMNIPICIAAVLLCLALFSTCFVSGLFARYAASTQSGDDARVARFSIEGECTLWNTIDASLIPGESKTVKIDINNDSEVALEYTVTVANETNNLPLELRMEKTGGAGPADTDTTFTGQWLPGSHTDKYTLYIKWDEDKNDPALMGMVDYIKVTVMAAQID